MEPRISTVTFQTFIIEITCGLTRDFIIIIQDATAVYSVSKKNILPSLIEFLDRLKNPE